MIIDNAVNATNELTTADVVSELSINPTNEDITNMENILNELEEESEEVVIPLKRGRKRKSIVEMEEQSDEVITPQKRGRKRKTMDSKKSTPASKRTKKNSK